MSKARMGYKQRLQTYYQLAKPGIIYGNLMTAVAGYCLGSALQIDWLVFVALLAGLALTIGGACVTNNYLDRSIDARMARTTKRALVSGAVSGRQAIIYATVLTPAGLTILVTTQNRLTAGLIAFAWFAYVVLYGYAKRHSVHGTLVGCISGSLPLVVGYTAAVDRLDIVCLQLFILMTAWQMAHFYGIALYRLTDYAAAAIPVMPAVHGARSTQMQSLAYMALFIATALWMIASGTLTVLAGLVVVGAGIVWLIRAVKTLAQTESSTWGRASFLFSLLVIMALSLSFVANPLLPL